MWLPQCTHSAAGTDNKTFFTREGDFDGKHFQAVETAALESDKEEESEIVHK
jgi:hypothetical protein